MYRRSRRKRKNNIGNNIILIILIACLIYISIGYAFYTQDVNIFGNARIVNYVYNEGDLTVTYTWTNTGWQIYEKTVYKISVTVTNNTNHVVDGWKVHFDFPETAELQYAYNCTYSKDDPSNFYSPTYTYEDKTYNVLLPIGDSANFQIDIALLEDPSNLNPIGNSQKTDDSTTNTIENTVTNTTNTIENTITNTTNTIENTITNTTNTIDNTLTNTTNSVTNTDNTTGETPSESDKILSYTDTEAGVYIEMVETNVWGSYSANFTFTIHNNNTTTINKWYIELTIPDGVSSISLWGGNATTTGNILSLGSGTEEWNTYPIEAGGSFTINGQLTSTSKSVVPIVSKVTVEL